MKISVKRGEVPIRSVIVRSHLEGRIFSFTIATPLDRHPIVTLGSSVTSGEGLSQRVELFRARRTLGEFDPSSISFTPEGPRELMAMDAGLFEIEWSRWSVLLVAIAADVLGTGHVVESWELFEKGGADYIGGGNLE